MFETDLERIGLAMTPMKNSDIEVIMKLYFSDARRQSAMDLVAPGPMGGVSRLNRVWIRRSDEGTHKIAADIRRWLSAIGLLAVGLMIHLLPFV
jgi:hypothetical protein